MDKPFSNACANNQQPILQVLEQLFAQQQTILEIGSGTGQHAVYFGARLPHLQWHTSDRIENHPAIRLWCDDAGLDNVHPPIELDVCQPHWPSLSPDAIFSANAVHIMGWPEVKVLFARAGEQLRTDGLLVLYGPFNYHNRYTSDSNARFDSWLKQQNPVSAIRNFEDLDRLANRAGLQLREDIAMPANNRILCWQKSND